MVFLRNRESNFLFFNVIYVNRIKLCMILERVFLFFIKYRKVCNIRKVSIVGDVLNFLVIFISYNDGKFLKRNCYLNVFEVL